MSNLVDGIGENIMENINLSMEKLIDWETLTFLNRSMEIVGACEKAVRSNPEDNFNWYQLGLVHSYAGQLDKAIIAFEKISIHGDSENSKNIQSKIYNNLCLLYNAKGDRVSADINYQKALKVLLDLAALCKCNGDVFNAEKHYFNALKLSKEFGSNEEIAQVCSKLGVACQLTRNISKAEEYSLTALILYKEGNNIRELANTYCNLGCIRYIQNDYELAFSYWSKSLKLFTETNIVEMINQVKDFIDNLSASGVELHN